jgi:hypothetical protein
LAKLSCLYREGIGGKGKTTRRKIAEEVVVIAQWGDDEVPKLVL